MPAFGDQEQGRILLQQYEKTLALYKKRFGYDCPWPNPYDRFHPKNYLGCWVDLKRFLYSVLYVSHKSNWTGMSMNTSFDNSQLKT